MKLRPDQDFAIERLRHAIRDGNRRVVLKLPTGGGKTVIAGEMIRGALAKGNHVAFVVDSISLVDQTVVRFGQMGMGDQVGVIQADHPLTDLNKPIQVISIDTLRSRPGLLTVPAFADKLKLVIYDECHCQKEFMYDWMGRWNNILFIGLSATPWARGMGKHWQHLVNAGTVDSMVRMELLSPYRMFVMAKPDLGGVGLVADDYNQGELATRLNTRELVSDIVGKWKQHAENRSTLVFCVDRAHAKNVQGEFQRGGIVCEYVDAFTPREEREKIGQRLGSGETQVVASIGCLTKGVDWDVRCIVLARSTKSDMLYMQMIGRGLRTAEGKDYCLILDHSNTIMALGLPEDVEARHYDLDGGERPDRTREQIERQERQPTDCPACGAVKAVGVHVCPNCGFAPERQTDVQEVQAELAELVPKAKRKINRDTSPEEKAAFFGGLKAYGNLKGYSPGWAANQYREKFGVWPNAYKDAPLVEPNEMVRGWIKHQAIRYHARRRSA